MTSAVDIRLFAAGGWIVKHLLLTAVVAFLLGPSIVVIGMSFSATPFLRFPPPELGLRHYEALFGASAGAWWQALVTSIQLAAAVSVSAVVLGGLFAFGMYRTQLARLRGVEYAMLGPIVVPIVSYAVALYAWYASLGLTGTATGIYLAHTIHALPFAALILGAALARLPRDVEHAAMNLGAGRFRAYRDITVRLATPAIAVAALFAFVISFDEVVLVSFLSGPGFVTLPLMIFHSLLFGLDPVVSAIATMLMFFTVVTLVSLAALSRMRSLTRPTP